MFVPVEVRGCLCVQLHAHTSRGEGVGVKLHAHTSRGEGVGVKLHAHTSRGEGVGVKLHAHASRGVCVQLHVRTSRGVGVGVKLHVRTSRGEGVGVKLLSAFLPPQGPQPSSCQSVFQEADAGVFAQCSQHQHIPCRRGGQW